MLTGSEIKKKFLEESKDILLGQEDNLVLTLVCFLARGHLLIEDLPGMGKTTMVKVVGALLGLDVSRIQCTSDLLPQDVLGSSIYKQSNEQFELLKGPIFSQLVFVDELNRASPKTQSAFLEAMEEEQITIEGNKISLPKPFFLIATQNPRYHLGTHFLPESQLDRFLFSMSLGYPDRETEKKMLLTSNLEEKINNLQSIGAPETFIKLRDAVPNIHIEDDVINYLLDLVDLTRKKQLGLSPRASKQLLRSAQAYALIEGRDFVIPEDIKAVAPNLIAHRFANQGHDDLSVLLDNACELLTELKVS